MTGKYILEDGQPKLIDDVLLWGRWFEDHPNERRVAITYLSCLMGSRERFVSTVFLGLDHGYGESEKPVLWESLDFPEYETMTRYTSREDAIAGHWAMVEELRPATYRIKITTHAPIGHAAQVQCRDVRACDQIEAEVIIRSEGWAFGIQTLDFL